MNMKLTNKIIRNFKTRKIVRLINLIDERRIKKKFSRLVS